MTAELTIGPTPTAAANPGSHPAPRLGPRTATYDELGAHRHLVVSERLRLRRRELGLTQKEVVARLRRAGVCTTNKALSGLEHGAGLDVGKLPELSMALECTLTYLVGLTDDPTRWEPDAAPWRAASRPGPEPKPVVGVPTGHGGAAPPILGPLG